MRTTDHLLTCSKADAETLLSFALRLSRAIDDIYAESRTSAAPVRETMADCAGRLRGDLHFALLEPIFDRFPTLRPEQLRPE